MKTFIKLSTSLLYVALTALALSVLFDLSPCVVLAVLVAASLINFPKGVALMALQKEIWERDIIENLYKDNEFAGRAFNADEFVLAGKVVHIPVAGTAAAIKKNLGSFPQTAVNRGDSEITYAIDTYYALPRQIQDIEKYELSYDKRQSVVGEDQLKLVQEAMNGLLYRWAPAAANVIETDGADSATDMIDDTATGTRKLFTKNAFKAIAKKFARADFRGTRITALLTAVHYHQLFESLSDAEKTNFNNVANLATGVIGKYMGIEIMMRSSVLRYRKVSNVWTVVDEQADLYAAGINDAAASLFWVDNSVERAKGDVKMFEDNGNPLYYGDVFSALVRLGGRIRRTAGVYAVVEATTPAS